MLFRPADLAAIAAGEVTVAFRRWKRPMAKAGGTQHTAAGVLAFDAVDRVERITPDDARRAGFADPEAAWAMLRGREGDLYRITLRLAGPDPRIALREDAALTAADRADIAARLTRLDHASSHGPWTEATLRAIAASPGTRAADLAERFGRERLPFKADVRKLKGLGLTESLEVGYRLSPRGRAYLAAVSESELRRQQLDLTRGRRRRRVEHGVQGKAVDQGVHPLGVGLRSAEQLDRRQAEPAQSGVGLIAQRTQLGLDQRAGREREPDLHLGVALRVERQDLVQQLLCRLALIRRRPEACDAVGDALDDQLHRERQQLGLRDEVVAQRAGRAAGLRRDAAQDAASIPSRRTSAQSADASSSRRCS